MADTQTPLSFKVHGMTCADEVVILKRELGSIFGEDRLAFDILNSRMTVGGEGPPVSAQAVIDAVAGTGMTATPWRQGEASAHPAGFLGRHGQTALTAASGVLGLAGLLVHARAAGGFAGALGSEGMGLAPEVPLVARLSTRWVSWPAPGPSCPRPSSRRSGSGPT